MTVATWQVTHAYAADAIVNPTVANGHSFRCSVAGTSGGSEPTWVGRYQNITDGSVTWVPYSIITPAQVRQEMKLAPEGEGASSPAADGQYADSIIGPYILAAIESLEVATKRRLVNRPGYVHTLTSMLRATLPLPNFRVVDSVVYGGATLSASAYWLLADALDTGVYTGIQFRAFRSSDSGPWWLADPLWFDKNLDSPFNPGNLGGGYVFTSMPNDTIITGTAGYEPLFEPGNVVHAVEVLSAWYTMRPPAILADSAITPAGGIVSYAQMPPEVQEFVKTYSGGQQVVSIG